MEKSKIEEKILEVLETLNISVENYPNEDIDLVDCIEDSVHFVTLVVSLEEALDVTIPDDFLQMDNFHSLNGLVSMLTELVLAGEAATL